MDLWIFAQELRKGPLFALVRCRFITIIVVETYNTTIDQVASDKIEDLLRRRIKIAINIDDRRCPPGETVMQFVRERIFIISRNKAILTLADP